MSRLRLLPFVVPLAACQPAPVVGSPPDRSCIPDWPESCLGEDPGSEGEVDDPYECEDPPELEDGQLSVYACFPKLESGECPAVDSACVADAYENQYVVDCRDCLRSTVEPTCGPNPEVDDACCYRAIISQPDQDECG